MLSEVFKAYDIRGVYPRQLDDKIARRIGCATGLYLKQQLTGRDASDPMLQHVVVGRDMRKSSPRLANALIHGLRAADMNVLDVGMVDTSFIYFAINHLGCAGGIQTTASHNPPQYNGFKISGRHAAPIGSTTGLDDIKRKAAALRKDPVKNPDTRVEQRDLWDDYRQHVRSFLTLKRPLTVVADASNGMAGRVLPEVFDGVDDLDLISLNLEMAGKFAHDPNPLVAKNMIPTQQAVRKHKADLGVCFDGDADRCILTDENGDIIGCDLLGALMAKHFLKSHPGQPVVYDLRSSKALMETVNDLGGQPIRARVGHVFIKQIMRELNGLFGAELSGHSYFRDNFYADSGFITFATALTILSNTTRPLSKLIKPFARYAQSGETNFEVEDKDEMIARLRKTYRGRGEIDDLDGITIDAMKPEGWWFNVRKSNTEPMLRLNLETRNAKLLSTMLAELTEMMGQPVEGH
ncbi:MAG: phosphomannomutase/phosphoglucomutase [Planctomycetaceae bacterium]|nr:phosphomannomutase/phosphoglucomutase [Planctomycetaceae bacterium]